MRTTFLLSAALLVLLPADALSVTPSVSGFGYSSAALKADGSVLTWGYNKSGQLGLGDTAPRLTPSRVGGLSDRALAISAGLDHMLALMNDGTIRAWGSNEYGQLGENTTAELRLTPVPVSGLVNVTAISAGGWHSIALKRDGTVWAWGNNRFGSLGDGTNTDRRAPVQVSGLTGVVAISAGAEHSMALKSDGTVWAWGDNSRGTVGDGTRTDRWTPVRVTGLTAVRAISSGGNRSLALRADGTVWTWGYNSSSGLLGAGTTTTYELTPLQVNGLTDIATIAAGWDESLALKSDGTVWAWGANTHGNLGDGTTTTRSTPVQTLGLAGIAVISIGDFHALALKNDGTVWAWGTPFVEGGLGDGTQAARLIPVGVHAENGVGTLALGASASFKVIAPVVITGAASGLITGSASDLRVSVTATASFPPQYVGRPIFLFAYVPTSLLHSLVSQSKDEPSCGLAQITPSGGLPAVAGASQLNSYGNNVLNANSQSITMLSNVLLSQTAGSALCVGVGSNGTEATTPGNFVCPASVPDANGAACQPPAPVTSSTGGVIARTLGSRATVSPAVTLYGGFELTNAATVYILVRGNSLSTLGVTQEYLDAPRVRLYNSQGQDVLFDSNGAGFNGCSSTGVSAGPVVTYYTSVRGQPPHLRDACTAQNLAAGAYTFSVSPSTSGASSSPNSGQILFEVTLGGGSGSIAKTLGSRATASRSATLYGGFELASAAAVYILVRGNSLSTLGITQNYLDAPRVRLYNSQGQDLLADSIGVGFNGCAIGSNSADVVVSYYTSVRGQPPHLRDACTARTFPAGAYTFSVTPSSSGVVSAPASGEILFEVTLQ